MGGSITDPDYSGLHDLFLLGIQGKSPGWGWVPLITIKRLAWFVGLWLAGVTVLSVLAFIIRWGLGL